MKNLTVGKKFSLGCAALVTLCLAIGIVSVVNIQQIYKNLQSITGDSLPGVYQISLLKNTVVDMRGNFWKYIVLAGNPTQQAKVDSAIASEQQQIQDTLTAYEKTITTNEDRQQFDKIKPSYEQYIKAWDDVATLARAGKGAEAAQKYLTDIEPPYETTKASIGALVEWNNKNGEKNADATTSIVTRANVCAWSLLAISILVGSVLAFFITKSVNSALNRVITELSEGAEQIASAASQVASSGQSLAQGSSEQAASLEETSASSEEINSMARKNTDNSKSAADLVSASQQRFTQTNQSLEQTVRAMSEINAQSSKISKIIKTIDEIAFQTNILALNAAVEAARAGEAGMGFAVVADEVRNLAQRCAQAAKDTSALIEESIAKSDDGKAKVDQVAVAIQTLTEEAGTIKTLVDEVNIGSQEQARGIQQIAKAISQMEQVTQKTAASAEESASAAEELTAQSETLKDIVGRISIMVSGEAVMGRGSKRASVVPDAFEQRKASNAGKQSPSIAPRLVHDFASSNKNRIPLEADFQEF